MENKEMLWLFNPAVPVLYNRKGRKWSCYYARFTPYKKLIPDAQSKGGGRQKAWVSQFTGVRTFWDSSWELTYMNRGAHHSQTVVLFALFSQKENALKRRGEKQYILAVFTSMLVKFSAIHLRSSLTLFKY